MSFTNNTNYFDEHWKSLDPIQAKPLVKANGSHDLENSDSWLESAETFVLPFHSFEAGYEFSIRFSKILSDYALNFLWEVLYHNPQAGTSHSYATDLLVNKRTIYEQGGALRDVIEINSNSSEQSYKEDNNFEKLLSSNLSMTAILNIDRRQNAKESLNGSLCSVSTSFLRFKETAVLKDKKTIYTRVSLSNYWLDWVEIAQRASFDFDYLSDLSPIEMRFYELIQLLRFKNKFKSAKELKTAPLEIGYSELTKLMPLNKQTSLADMESQINQLCREHIKRKYLKNYSFIQVRKKNLFTDAVIKFEF